MAVQKINNPENLRLLVNLCLGEKERAIQLPQDPDWDSLLYLAISQGLAPLLHHKLNRLGLWSRCPRDFREALRYVFGTNMQRSEFQKRELVAIANALGREGIPVMPYKGCFLSQFLYGDPYLRVSADIDLIIPRKDVKRAWEILTGEEGYRPLSPEKGFVEVSRVNEYNFKLESPGGKGLLPQAIEVHWEQVRSYTPLRIPMDEIWEKSPPTNLWGTTFHIPPEPLHFLMVAIHATDDNWPLKCLVDVAAFFSRLSHDEKKEVEREAHQWKLHGLLEACLEKVEQLEKGTLPLTEADQPRRSYGRLILARTLELSRSRGEKLKYLLGVLTYPSFRDYDLIPGKKKSKALATLLRPYRLLKEWFLR